MKLPMIVAALAMLAAVAAHAERRVALIIGNGAYANVAKLPNTTRDAEAMEATFHAAGFELVEAAPPLHRQELVVGRGPNRPTHGE